jgi:hypothetical protein
VSGGAGTGQTVLALEKARRLAAEGLEVLLTCFNKPLAEFLRRCSGQADRLTIANFHQFCWQMAQEAGVPLPGPAAGEPPPGFFDATLPEALLTALERLPARGFDAIVVDEGSTTPQPAAPRQPRGYGASLRQGPHECYSQSSPLPQRQ